VNISLPLFFGALGVFVVIRDQCQVSFRLHARVDYLCQLLFVFFLDRVDFVPSVILNRLSHLLVIAYHCLDDLFEPVSFLDLLFKLNFLLLLELLDNLVVVQIKLVQSFVESSRFVFLLVAKLGIAKLICFHLVIVVLFSSLELYFMGLGHLANFFFIRMLHVLLGFK
jgi:hypothetical protein